MKNLLIAASAAHSLNTALEHFKDKVRIVSLEPDGSLHAEGAPTTPEAHPIHLAWLSQELMREGSLPAFSKLVLKAPSLEWMQTVSAGLDHPMFKQVVDKGATLTNSDAQAPAIAEYVVGSALYFFQSFPERVAHQAAKDWKPVPFREIWGSNWLIVGFGNIGERVGKMVQGFDGKVIGVKRSQTTHPHADEIVTFDDMPNHIGEADVIVLSCALTDQTRDLVDAEFFSRLKPGSILINIARGDVIDEDALLDALNGDRLAYAVLDVFKTEPLPVDSPLWSHEKVHLTPHASNSGRGTQPRGRDLFLANLAAYLNGTPLRNEVRPGFW